MSRTSTDQARPAPDPGTAAPVASGRLGWVLIVAGAVGFTAAFVLAVEKYLLLADPSYVPSCSLNPVVSCGSVMESAYAQALGFPNPLLGIVAFTIVIVSGVLVAAGVRLPAWYWTSLHAGATVGVLFVHWLIFVSLYRIGALCPYCMAVWAATIIIFFYLTLHVAQAAAQGSSTRTRRLVDGLATHHTVVLVVWFLVIITAVLQAFWLYWTSLLN